MQIPSRRARDYACLRKARKRRLFDRRTAELLRDLGVFARSLVGHDANLARKRPLASSVVPGM
jgi:hypothetical protein